MHADASDRRAGHPRSRAVKVGEVRRAPWGHPSKDTT